MKLNIFTRLLNRLARQFFLPVKRMALFRMLKHQGFAISDNISIDLRGTLSFGRQCGVGMGSVVNIPERASLLFGNNCYVGQYVELSPGGCIKVGDNTSIQNRCILLGDIRIGRYCLFAPNVYISSGRHYFDLNPDWLIKDQDDFVAGTNALAEVHSNPVTIDDDCWIGINVVVMAGVTIGRGAIIGANSVVNRNVAPYSVMAGAPAKIINKRLKFIPPRQLDYRCSADFPYFYSGFEVSKSEISKNVVYQGLVAHDEFSVCLDAAVANCIHVMIRVIGEVECVLFYGEQRVWVANKSHEVIFKVDEYSKQNLRFDMRAMVTGSRFVIEKVWVQ